MGRKKVDTDKAKKTGILVLVTEEEKDFIFKVAFDNKEKVSGLARELLLGWAKKKSGDAPKSAEKVQREVADLPPAVSPDEGVRELPERSINVAYVKAAFYTRYNAPTVLAVNQIKSELLADGLEYVESTKISDNPLKWEVKAVKKPEMINTKMTYTINFLEEEPQEATSEPIPDTIEPDVVEEPIKEEKPVETAFARDSGKTVRYKMLNENHRRKWTRVPALIVPMSDQKREEIRTFIHDVLDEHKYGIEVEVLREKCRYTGGDLVYKDRYTIDELMTVILSDDQISYHEDSSSIQYATRSKNYERKDGEYEWKSCINGINFTSSEAEIVQARDFIKNLLAEKQTDMRICEIVFAGREHGIQARPISDAIEAYRDSVFSVNSKNIVRLI